MSLTPNKNCVNEEQPIEKHTGKMKVLKSMLFAFGNDDIYKSMCSESEDPHNQSNFFSTINDSSQWIKINSELNFENLKNQDNNENDYSTIMMDEEMGKNLEFLNLNDDDDLNDAKLDDSSIFSEKYSTILNPKDIPTQKYDQTKNTQSFSSVFNPNYINNSNSSSFVDNFNCTANSRTAFNSQQNMLFYNGNFTGGGNNYFLNSNYNNNPYGQENSFISDLHNLNHSNLQNTKSSNINPVNPNNLNIINTGNKYPFISKPSYNFNAHDSINSESIINNNTFHYTNQATNFKRNLSIAQRVPLGRNTHVVELNTQSFKASTKTGESNLKSLNSSKQSCILTTEEKFILENIRTFAKDSNKCRLVQSKFDEKREFHMHFFEKAKSFLTEIICDPFGNYVCQKFIETCPDPKYISNFLESIKGNLFNIAINSYGTRGLQKLLEYISTDNDLQIIKEFITALLMNLIKDNTGNHVVQQTIVFFPKHSNNFIYEEVIKNIVEISKLKQGGCIITKLLNHANEEQRDFLCYSVVNSLSELINDEFGNFIVQQIFKFRNKKYNEIIVQFIHTNLITLSTQKYSSNVIDKCMLKEDYCDKNIIAEIIISKKSVVYLTEDKYGNYIIQMLLEVVDSKNFGIIIEILKKKLKKIRNSPYGEKIYQKLVTKYKDHLGVDSSVSGTSTRKYI